MSDFDKKDAKVSEVKVPEVKVPEVKSLKLSRSMYTDQKGKSYYIYGVKGVLRGKNMEASMQPGDVGGYELLDVVFGNSDEADLIVEKTTRIVNYTTGEKQDSTVYHAHSVDENGTPYDCIVRPREASDRQILTHLFAQIGVFIN